MQYADSTNFSCISTSIRDTRRTPSVITPMCWRDRDRPVVNDCTLCRFVLLPLYKVLGDLFPIIHTEIMEPLHRALDYWTDLERVTKARQVSDRVEHINAVVTNMNDFSLTPSKIMLRLDLY